ncbi:MULTISPECIES: UvrD-helicase domain-containing protein [Leeuwenhoekiella]|uniref:DNA 3'-5' helicase n=1 Tax=Leeuwenhoekiella blandensis (strain CECT 7118 / CCUG 51940 / KCTC 22103 / MED217) TaxID=398720 RepID=A3XQM7_LEEBM|nr:UvrD-helicase domain-containing protein [Leeuwenhoekiella blandensis]EAQ48144.1 putative helicase [Leeuwenhoekiella blandensis MED217]|tara:strand:- start:55251 stop:58394 length:3144 start_codon:yes stop_codon:yes gene_type:complete
MQNHHSISVYNASAGAGKTFALVKNYLSILFKSSNDFKYRRILAITFTNKAVAEMKTRIIKNLQDFSSDAIFTQDNPMLSAVEEETGLERSEIQNKAKRILKHIVQDYASFDVVTIDNFTHRIIRTFAYDLKIPQNFEVELNTQDVLEQAVDSLIDKAGKDQNITRVLLDYALEKIDNDKSWDISRDFYDISKLLLSENDREYLQRIKSKSLDDFEQLKAYLKTSTKHLEKEIQEAASALITFIASNGLEATHFTRKYLPKALDKMAEGDFNVNFNTKWVQNLGQEPMYTKSQKEPIKAILDKLSTEITSQFNAIKPLIFKLKLNEELYKKITPLSLLQLIQQEVEKIKSENNLVLISDFNELIHKNIANQPTPFIYERLGERYENYFIDEFQDTSVLQWSNLVPLIDNAVSTSQTESVSNSVMLVGDPKQAIYRWRGGEAEQFIRLSKSEVNPFQNEDKKTIDLPQNYRSYDQIINFNNEFFTHVSSDFSYAEYENIYKSGNAQQINHRIGGQVTLNFIEGNTVDELTPLYLDEVVKTIETCVSNNFELGELCILVRRNSEGVAIAQRLQEENIPVISSESLLLKQSPQVQFIINLLHYTIEPQSSAITLNILEYLAKNYLEVENAHEFYKEHLKYTGANLFQQLSHQINNFDFEQCALLPIYEAAEYIIRCFDLNKNGGAYLQFFLDAIFDFAQKNSGGIPELIIWWNRKQDKLSISTPPTSEAVQIMTIHKAKGLEFPVVIYPFAHTELYSNHTDTYNWYLPESDNYQGFEALLLGQKAELTEYNEQTAMLYHHKRIQQQLDTINVLYVALTRSVEQLHIISKTGKDNAEPKNFADLFVQYLSSKNLYESETRFYSFGDATRKSGSKPASKEASTLRLLSTAREDHDLSIVTQAEALWDDSRQEALSMGNIIHELMAGIKTIADIDSAVNKALTRGWIEQKDVNQLSTQLRTLISALEEIGFFNHKHLILNERDINSKGQTIRPDRVEIGKNNSVWLLDYKTGTPNATHKNQVEQYATTLETMNYKVILKALIYLNDQNPIVLL